MHNILCFAVAPSQTCALHASSNMCNYVQGVCDQNVPIQCRLTGTEEASVSGFQGHTPCTTCVYISHHTAKQAMLADSDLVLLSKAHPRYTQSMNMTIKVVPRTCEKAFVAFTASSCVQPLKLCSSVTAQMVLACTALCCSCHALTMQQCRMFAGPPSMFSASKSAIR